MLYIAIGIYLVNRHRKILQMTQFFQFHFLSLLRTNPLMIVGHAILRIGDLRLLITQIIHSGPLSPLVQGLMDIVITLGRMLDTIAYSVVTHDGQLSSLQ